MSASDEKLSNLYENFKEYETNKDLEERSEKKKLFQDKLSAEKITELSEGDVRELIRNFWSFQMWTNKDYVVEEILKDGLDHLKKILRKALYESSNKSEAYEILKDDVRQMGPASASELLTCIFPNNCGIWNEKARRGLEILSYSDELPLEEKQIEGEEHEKFNNTLSEIGERLDNLNHDLEDFLELDYFLFYMVEKVSEEKEEK